MFIAKENPYEYLYMYRKGDYESVNRLLEYFNAKLHIETNILIQKYPILEMYKEDMFQDGKLCILQAIDTFREDIKCSLTSYMMTVARRKMIQRTKQYVMPFKEHYGKFYDMDFILDNGSPLYSCVEQKDALANPAYFSRFNTAREQFYSKVENLSKDELLIYESCTGKESYIQACKRLNMSYKQYDGKVQRLKRKLKMAVKA